MRSWSAIAVVLWMTGWTTCWPTPGSASEPGKGTEGAEEPAPGPAAAAIATPGGWIHVDELRCLTELDAEILATAYKELVLFQRQVHPATVKAVRDSAAAELRFVMWERDWYREQRPRWWDDQRLWWLMGATSAALVLIAAGTL